MRLRLRPIACIFRFRFRFVFIYLLSSTFLVVVCVADEAFHSHRPWGGFCYVTLFLALAIVCASKVVEVRFQRNYKVVWGDHHIFFLQHGREVQLSIDKTSGAGFRSKLEYASGFFQMRIMIPNKNSRGVVTAFYLTSTADEHKGAKHDEIDFEFLGNNGKPYTLQTNVFANDEGGREQRHSLWFDPSIDFHNYAILWNQHQIVFYVDGIPIRVFKNNSKVGVSYPTQQMRVMASIWNGEPWASNGKRIDWKQAPFTAHFQGHSSPAFVFPYSASSASSSSICCLLCARGLASETTIVLPL
ncbi:hypothetical protein Fmac_011241 [Flemingia macrophylla]|uniref:GH16 domain-containing protein n=1 Tax=Flemingia macrophylla TaxID=520843 RepID=A0ABD1MLV6_9FABA